jgi:hypothetical protein
MNHQTRLTYKHEENLGTWTEVPMGDASLEGLDGDVACIEGTWRWRMHLGMGSWKAGIVKTQEAAKRLLEREVMHSAMLEAWIRKATIDAATVAAQDFADQYVSHLRKRRPKTAALLEHVRFTAFDAENIIGTVQSAWEDSVLNGEDMTQFLQRDIADWLGVDSIDTLSIHKA